MLKVFSVSQTLIEEELKLNPTGVLSSVMWVSTYSIFLVMRRIFSLPKPSQRPRSVFNTDLDLWDNLKAKPPLCSETNQDWPRGYNTFSCSTQLSMKYVLLINVKMPTIVGILTLISE